MALDLSAAHGTWAFYKGFLKSVPLFGVNQGKIIGFRRILGVFSTFSNICTLLASKIRGKNSKKGNKNRKISKKRPRFS